MGRGYPLPLSGPASPLGRSRGIVFPYTPVIARQQSVEFSSYELIHTNYPIQSYMRSRPGNIQVTANFINQTREETLYTIAAMHFLNVVTKMHFGQADNDRGTPPPVLEFSAYGDVNFRRVPVLVGGYTINFPDDVDYVSSTMDSGFVSTGNQTYLPVLTVITIDLIPHYNPLKQNQFNLPAFARGDLYSSGFI